MKAPYLCALPPATYLSAIGQTLPATAAAYPCDCDPLDHHSHDSPGIHTIGCLPSLYRAAHHCSGRLSRVSLWVRVPWEPCMNESYINPDDKGLSLFWYAIKTRAVAGYQKTVRSHVITIR